MREALVLLSLAMLGALAACGEAKDAPLAEAKAPECPAIPAEDYVWIPGATFAMGADAHLPEEGPARDATVAGFWMSTHEVTNAEFAEFVKATGYKTLAEQDPPKLPGAPPGLGGVHRADRRQSELVALGRRRRVAASGRSQDEYRRTRPRAGGANRL